MNRRRISADARQGRAVERRQAALAFLRRLGAMILAGLVLYGGWRGAHWMQHGHEFRIQNIAVSGVHRSDEADLLRRAHLSAGRNIFAVNTADAAAAMEQADWVAHAKVARALPSTVRVEIEERQPVAVANVGGLVVVDADAHEIKPLNVADQLDLPVISGLSAEDIGNVQHGPSALGAATLHVLAAYQADRMAKVAPLSELRVSTASGETTYTAFCGDDPAVEVALGAFGSDPVHEMSAVLRRFERLWMELASEGRRARSIDLGNRARADWVPVRLEPAQPG